MTRELFDALRRWAQHAAEHPESLGATATLLRAPTGVIDVDAHNVLLADLLVGVRAFLGEQAEAKS